MLTARSNRRLDNKLNILEGLHRNYFFIVINLIMIGGQVMIIFVGGQAFKVVRLTGKEWALSVGLGAISIPWGALIRLTPDSWLSGCLPWFMARIWAKNAVEEKSLDIQDDEDNLRPPLRMMSSLRGPRVQQHVGFRARMLHIKERTKEKMATAAEHGTEKNEVKSSPVESEVKDSPQPSAVQSSPESNGMAKP